MLYLNPSASRNRYPVELRQLLAIETATESRAWLTHWNRINMQATPLIELPGIAARLGVAKVAMKDESVRSQVGSFKALGAPIALIRLLLRIFPEQQLDAAALFHSNCREIVRNIKVISATDGNHGRALAAAAQSVGCSCVIVLHAGVSREREEAIAEYGATIIRITGNYDASVEEAARLAAANHWHVVSDTSYEGYEEIPRDVMQGYAIIGAEVAEQSNGRPEQSSFTHVLLQGGVGGFAAGVASYLWEYHGAHRPYLIVVEPREADCLYQSAIAGRPARATGAVDSLMAGLACGECSPLAWKILQPCIDAFLVIDDDMAVAAMQNLAEGSRLDIPVVAGESGAAGLAGLHVLLADERLKKKVQLHNDARVLLINTEGATSPTIYRDLVGETATSVLARQTAWQG